jgi:hypothetical protein
VFMILNLYFHSCSAGLEKFSSIQGTEKLVFADGICKSSLSFDWCWVFYSLLVNVFIWCNRWLPIFWRTCMPQLSFTLRMEAASASETLVYVCQITLHHIFECRSVNTLKERPTANGYVWCITDTVIY